jgi:hypothetical protein
MGSIQGGEITLLVPPMARRAGDSDVLHAAALGHAVGARELSAHAVPVGLRHGYRPGCSRGR